MKRINLFYTVALFWGREKKLQFTDSKTFCLSSDETEKERERETRLNVVIVVDFTSAGEREGGRMCIKMIYRSLAD